MLCRLGPHQAHTVPADSPSLQQKGLRDRLEKPGVQMIQAGKGLLILFSHLWLRVWDTGSLDKGEDVESRSV